MQNLSKYFPFLLFIFYFSLCLTTLSFYPTAFGDSNEVIAAGFSSSALHPPGMPLQTVIVYLFSHLPIPATTIAFKANLVSALFHSLTLVFVYATSTKILNFVLTKKKRGYFLIEIISLTTALSLGCSYLFWLYSNTLEVYPINNFLAISSFYLALQIYEQKKTNLKQYLLLGILLGSGLAQHPTFILVIPGLLVLLWFKIRKSFILGFQLSITTISTFIFATILLLLFNQNSPITWAFQKNLNGLWRFISSADHVQSDASNAYLTTLYLPENITALIRYLATTLPQNFTWLGVMLFLLGIFGAYKHLSRRVFWGLITLIVCTGPILAFYLTFPSSSLPPAYVHMITGVTERMYLLGFVFLSLLLSLAFYQLTIWVKVKQLVFVFLLFPLYLLISNYHAVDLSNYNFAQAYAQQTLQNAQPNSTIFCFSDISCFSFLYEQTIHNKHLDKIIISAQPNLGHQFRQKYFPELARFDSLVDEQRIGNMIDWSLKNNRAVYLAELTPYYLETLGLDGKNYALSPNGYLLKVTRTQAQLKPFSYKIDQVLAVKPTDPRNQFELSFKAMLMQQHATNATLYARAGHKDWALQEAELANNLYSNQKEVVNLIEKIKNY
ncbi:DUF2723 domain-containing protein [Candidatus Beckwithbacteria bacterium]|nr:DUF2723 domain-containing protein [Candidatus Beckwithbacteria bacterium]